MWKYYALLTDLTPEAIEAERARGEPMASKLALAERIVSDFHGAAAAPAAQAEWRRIHQGREAPTDLPSRQIPAGTYKPHEFLADQGLAKSRSDAARLLKQRAVKRDGAVLDPSQPLLARAGEIFVVTVGARQFARFEVVADSGAGNP